MDSFNLKKLKSDQEKGIQQTTRHDSADRLM